MCVCGERESESERGESGEKRRRKKKERKRRREKEVGVDRGALLASLRVSPPLGEGSDT